MKRNMIIMDDASDMASTFVSDSSSSSPPWSLSTRVSSPVSSSSSSSILIPRSSHNLEMQRGIQNFLSSVDTSSVVGVGDTGTTVEMPIQGTSLVVAVATTTTPTPTPPTNEEIKLLREALGAIYGERNPEKALDLLTRAIVAWERQPPDERAALYRVRGDCFMELLDASAALQDYTTTLSLLTGPGGELADPAELPAAYLGQARALRSLPTPLSKEQYQTASRDYQLAMRLTSREEWDTNDELEADGAQRNPYAAWEWGMALRGEGNYRKAAQVHILASSAFKDIGDRARSVISKLDAGIDLAALPGIEQGDEGNKDREEAIKILKEGIDSTTSVEGRDVELLQRVIAKEGEARIALASILWSSANQKSEAESQLGEACGRLEQLQADADARAEKAKAAVGSGNKKSSGGGGGGMTVVKVKKLPFTIDDTVGTECSCSRFKNSKFLDSLVWPESLQEKVSKLNKLVSS